MATANLSAQAQESNTHIGASNPPQKVDCLSLPHSLRHISAHSALEDARAIAYYLYQSTAPEDNNFPLDAKGRHGLELIHALLIDKIEIGMRWYLFPYLTHEENAPKLAEREFD